jgi:hypothetical protein
VGKKSKRALAYSRKRAPKRRSLRLALAKQELYKREKRFHTEQFISTMLEMYRVAEGADRLQIEALFKNIVGVDLKIAREAHVIAALQKSAARRQ